MKKKVALLSVYEKTGIVEFAKELLELGWEILASGGTAKTIAAAGLPVKDVADLVGGGPILGHRVVTLSREIHAGLLARDCEEDREEMKKLGLPFIGLVCVDLYPLETEIKKAGSSPESVIEQTDTGGLAMLRSAAKGRRIVIADPADRPKVIDWLKDGRPNEQEFINRLAAKAEAVCAHYALLSARYHSDGFYDGMVGEQVLSLKYGENPWQKPAALFRALGINDDPLSCHRCQIVAGTDPSFINITDEDRLLQTITHIAAAFDANRGKVPFIAVGVKHGNPCGAAFGDEPAEVLRQMISGDTLAIHGGWVIANFAVTDELAEILLSYKVEQGRRLLDGLVAPAFSPQAIETLKRKKDKCRFIVQPALEKLGKDSLDAARRLRPVRGGFLTQPNYTLILDFHHPDLKVYGEWTEAQKDSLILAWAIGSTSNSNTITVVKVEERQLIGNGVGQQDRVGAARLAIWRADRMAHNTDGAVAYSDSFFPFPDGPAELAKAGVKVIFASSGSVKDKEVIATCQDAVVTLVMLPDAEVRGFFGH